MAGTGVVRRWRERLVATSWFETGLLDPSDWSASWIEPHEPEVQLSGDRPAYVLGTGFALDGVHLDARLHATAHGIYEAFINGHRVGNRELTPGFTSYPENLHVQVYDVSTLLVAGENR